MYYSIWVLLFLPSNYCLGKMHPRWSLAPRFYLPMSVIFWPMFSCLCCCVIKLFPRETFCFSSFYHFLTFVSVILGTVVMGHSRSVVLVGLSIYLACSVSVVPSTMRECRNVTTTSEALEHHGALCCANGTTAYWTNGEIKTSFPYKSYPCSSMFTPVSVNSTSPKIAHCSVCMNWVQLAVWGMSALICWVTMLYLIVQNRKLTAKLAKSRFELHHIRSTLMHRTSSVNSGLLIALDGSGPVANESA